MSTRAIIWGDKMAGWSISKLFDDATPDKTMQANRLTSRGYFKPRVLQILYKNLADELFSILNIMCKLGVNWLLKLMKKQKP